MTHVLFKGYLAMHDRRIDYSNESIYQLGCSSAVLIPHNTQYVFDRDIQ